MPVHFLLFLIQVDVVDANLADPTILGYKVGDTKEPASLGGSIW